MTFSFHMVFKEVDSSKKLTLSNGSKVRIGFLCLSEYCNKYFWECWQEDGNKIINLKPNISSFLFLLELVRMNKWMKDFNYIHSMVLRFQCYYNSYSTLILWQESEKEINHAHVYKYGKNLHPHFPPILRDLYK